MKKREIIEGILRDYGVESRYRSYGDKAGRVDFSIKGEECSIFFDEETVSATTEGNYEWFELEAGKFEDDIKEIFRWLEMMGYPLEKK